MTRARSRRPLVCLLAAGALALLLAACGSEKPRTPFIVIGIDGAEWDVIEELWDREQLPHLRALADRGLSTHLQTEYGKSPVIWTTVATGQPPSKHGVTGFIVQTEEGEVPVSSKLRRVPAIWNMLTLNERRVAVLGWYASWPADAVNGLMVTDHVMRQSLADRVYPPELQPEIDSRIEEILQRDDGQLYPYRAASVPRTLGERDVLLEELAPELASEGYDLLLVYYRSVDEVSHRNWKYWRPKGLRWLRGPRRIRPDELAVRGDWLPATYERVDTAIGRIAAAAPEANIMVLSDHGFHSANHLRVTSDFDALLEHLGYLVRTAGKVDMAQSQAFTTETLDFSVIKRVRLAARERTPNDPPGPESRAVIRRLAADLGQVRYRGGKPVFRRRKTLDPSVDLEVELLTPGISQELVFEDLVFDDVIQKIEHLSGGHSPDTHGIFIAAGPDIEPDADPSGISIHDITPTLLYALGLPVAEDFSGRPWTELFTEQMQLSHPVQTISSYSMGADGEALASESDEEILEELRALGYLD